ncbi:unnamed protein product [Allacma fusca]|uniref:Uncharacterized protein n=1 Tax=Allacma fusca TaxID=39272 RepID=A0A8J2LRP7_9HEXA|nr:unnamed protein product [Allacma fusca]
MRILNPGNFGKLQGSSPTNILITRKISKYFILGYNFGSWIVASPIVWDKSTNKSQLVSSWKLRLWTVNISMAVLYAIFVEARALTICMDSSKSTSEKMYMMFLIPYFVASLIVHLVVWQNKERMVAFNNECFRFASKFEKQYIREYTKQPWILKFIGFAVQLTYISIIETVALMTANAFIRADSPDMPSSLWSSSPTIFDRVISAAIMCHTISMFASSCFLILMSLFTSSGLILAVNAELSSKAILTTPDFKRSGLRKLRMWRILQIIIKVFNEIFCFVFLPCYKFLGSCLVVFCGYAGLKMEGIHAHVLMLVGSYVFVLLLLTFSFLAEFHFQSTAVLKEFKDRLEWDLNRHWVLRHLRALVPLRADMRSKYFIDRGMVLTLAHILVTNTASFLLVNT